MDGVGAGDGFRVRLRQTDIAYLPRLHELGHGTDGLLDRRIGVHTMLIVEVDVVRPEALQ